MENVSLFSLGKENVSGKRQAFSWWTIRNSPLTVRGVKDLPIDYLSTTVSFI